MVGRGSQPGPRALAQVFRMSYRPGGQGVSSDATSKRQRGPRADSEARLSGGAPSCGYSQPPMSAGPGRSLTLAPQNLSPEAPIVGAGSHPGPRALAQVFGMSYRPGGQGVSSDATSKRQRGPRADSEARLSGGAPSCGYSQPPMSAGPERSLTLAPQNLCTRITKRSASCPPTPG
jgi:hypothetical protein